MMEILTRAKYYLTKLESIIAHHQFDHRKEKKERNLKEMKMKVIAT